MNRTKIEYLDLTWNPIVGCSGLGCRAIEVCWAERMAKRQKHRCDECYLFVPHVHFERFDEPLKRKKPARIGVSFMGEFYDAEIAENIRLSLYMRMAKAHWHTFFILTKQPQNVDLEEPLPKNLWLGVSVNTKGDLWRIEALRQTNATVKAVSFEPLYADLGDINLKDIDWVIVGAQTRPYIRPKFSWLANIFDQTSELQIPLFTKNNLNLKRVVQQYPRDGIPILLVRGRKQERKR